MTIAREAVKFAKSRALTRHSRRKKDSFEDNDQVWAVFDRDDHPRFQEAVNLCEEHGIRVARSNPCFELWLILHEQDYNKPTSRSDLQGVLRSIRPEYVPKRGKLPNCTDLVIRVREAERRADMQLKSWEQAGLPYGNPSTTVGILTCAIHDADEAA